MNISREDLDVLVKTVKKTVRKNTISDRVASRISLDDLVQEGIVECLIAYKTYQPSLNDSIEAYFSLVARRAVGKYICEHGSLLTRPSYATESLSSTLEKDLSLFKDSNAKVVVEVEEGEDSSTLDNVKVTFCRQVEPQQLVKMLRDERVKRIKQELRRILNHDEKISLQVVVVGYSAQELADMQKWPITRIRKARKESVRKMQKSQILYEFWKEI